jgi:hypothetical protein
MKHQLPALMQEYGKADPEHVGPKGSLLTVERRIHDQLFPSRNVEATDLRNVEKDVMGLGVIVSIR